MIHKVITSNNKYNELIYSKIRPTRFHTTIKRNSRYFLENKYQDKEM